MKIDIQRLRNLTTGLLHTDIDCVYQDLGKIIGETGLMTHMLPRVMRAVEPWLIVVIKDNRFWDGKFDQSHVGEIELQDPTEADRKLMFERYKGMPNPSADKEVIVIQTGD